MKGKRNCKEQTSGNLWKSLHLSIIGPPPTPENPQVLQLKCLEKLDQSNPRGTVRVHHASTKGNWQRDRVPETAREVSCCFMLFHVVSCGSGWLLSDQFFFTWYSGCRDFFLPIALRLDNWAGCAESIDTIGWSRKQTSCRNVMKYEEL